MTLPPLRPTSSADGHPGPSYEQLHVSSSLHPATLPLVGPDPRTNEPETERASRQSASEFEAEPDAAAKWIEPEPDTGPFEVTPSASLIISAIARTVAFDGEKHATPITYTVRGRLRIGRDSTNEIRLSPDKLVSRFHAIIQLDKHRLTVRDLGSTNGTFVNGHRVKTTADLYDSSVILVGKSLILISAQAEAAPNIQCLQPKLNAADAIRAWRIGAGWSQSQLATAIGVSERTISNWECGESISRVGLEKLRAKKCPV